MDTKYLDSLLDEIMGKIPALSMAVLKGDKIIYKAYRGKIIENSCKIDENSRFDIASITKVFSGIAFMKMVEEGLFSLDEPVHLCFPELNKKYPIEKDGITVGENDASLITWKNVLNHTTGFGWTREKTLPSLPGIDKSLDAIFSLPFAYKTGSRVVYSDVPFILLGKAMEMKTGMQIDKIINENVIEYLNLKSTGYNRGNIPFDRDIFVPTEDDRIFRKERAWGYVHDENAFLLDGVAAHAGIFSNITDLVKVGKELKDSLKSDGILKRRTMDVMTGESAVDGEDRRGIMWQLSNNAGNPKAYTSVLSEKAFGHAGFTGCFMWIDPVKDMVIVFLSNDIYRGRDNRVLFDYRGKIMESCIKDNL